MTAALEHYRRQLAEELGRIDLRMIPGLAADPAAISLGLAATMVLPRLVDPRREGKPRAVGDVLAAARRAVVQGDPGAGKTTLLRCLCLAYADESSALLQRIAGGRTRQKDAPELPGELVPVLLSLSSFRPTRGSPGELERWIEDLLVEDHDATTASEVLAAVRAGRGLVCLDGLDEIADEGIRGKAGSSIEKWARRVGGVCWVTTRTHGALALSGFAAHAVQPFGREELFDYVSRRELACGRGPAEASRRAQAWLQRFAARPEALAVLRHPLLLVIALASEDAGRSLPTERVYLYENVIDTLVTAWNRTRRPADALQRLTGSPIDPDAMLRALATVALGFYEEGELGGAVHRGQWERALARRLGGGEPGELYARDVVKTLIEQVGLLVPEGPERLRFWHASLGEYLAATALARAARVRPEAIVGPTGSTQGREIVRMAVAWTRTVAGDPTLASRMLATLLDGEAGGPWTRLFGEPIGVAVDCVRDGHRLDAQGFSRVLGRVLDLVERAPSWEHAEMLATLAQVEPEFTPAPQEARRLLALPSAGTPLLPAHVFEAMMRWIARMTVDSPEAQALCMRVMAGRHDAGKLWAALGLLRAGVADPEVCRWVATRREQAPDEPLALDEPSAPPELRARRRAQLRALMAAPPTREEQQVGLAAAVVLALLGDDGEDVLATLLDGRPRDSSYRRASRAALAGVARASEPCRRWLAEALAGADEARRDAVVDVLQDMLNEPGARDAAVAVVFLALTGARARGLLPEAREILARRESIFRDISCTFHEALRRLATSEQDGLAALAARCCDRAGDFTSRWTCAAVIWEAAFRQRGALVGEFAPCLFEGAVSDETEVAVMSAYCLGRTWSEWTTSERTILVAAWVRGFASSGESTAKQDDPFAGSDPWAGAEHGPLDAIARAAWRVCEKLPSPLGPDERAVLRAALTSEQALQRVLAASVLWKDPAERSLCEVPLVAALRADDVRQVWVAFQALDPVEPELREAVLVAGIELVLAGWLRPFVGRHPPTRAMLATYLAAPCSIARYSWAWRSMAREMLQWLAQHPDTRELALSRLRAGERSEVATALLASWMDAPERVAAVVEAARAAGASEGVRAALREILQRERREPEPATLREAAEAGLVALLREDLESDELDALHDAVRCAQWYGLPLDVSPAVRARLLQAPTSAWRVEEAGRWLAIRCEPEQRESFAQRWFGLGLGEIAAALRPCAADDDLLAAIRAGLLLWRHFGESEPLRTAARRILERPGDDGDDGDAFGKYDDIYLLVSAAARGLISVTIVDRRLKGLRRMAVAALVELEDDYVVPALRRLLLAPEGLRECWWDDALAYWCAEHQPRSCATIEAEVIEKIASRPVHELSRIARWLRRASALSTPVLAALADRWSRWLYDEALGPDVGFASFIKGEEAVPDEVRLGWSRELDGAEPAARGRAALALAQYGETGEALVDRLIEVGRCAGQPACGRAYALLHRPERVEQFRRRRRPAAQRWQTPDEALRLAALWHTADEAEHERELTVPLLRAAAAHPDERDALQAASDLWLLDRAEGLAALRLLSPRSTGAAALLMHMSDPAGEDRLWWALEHAGADDHDWHAAALVLFRRDPADPRLAPALARIATWERDGRALWLLYAISPALATCATLDRLARTGVHQFNEDQLLYALCRGARPGAPPSSVLGGWWSEFKLSDDDDWSWRRESHEHPAVRAALGNASTLDALAAGLLALSRTVREASPPLRDTLVALERGVLVEIPAAMARSIDVAPERWTALWERAGRGDCSDTEVAEIRALVDVRATDRPGQRLARLWLRRQLPVEALLEREERSRRRIGDGAPASLLGHLDRLLAVGFPDESSLRAFLADQGLTDHVAGLGAAPQTLRFDAARALLSRKHHDEAVRRAVEMGALSEAVLPDWEALLRAEAERAKE
ncbi:NACHT domain-containing protein [Nannocystis pusilla]|uniref:NACHT domain-containing protein n=1 Tax=Nannocystis pusilla TaxID=889268 RepID=A0A9X3J060_9BACT|nr:NACHT domain-containing protein [Nannocystis pusilla]MCY1009329.1 NACHT domain-containing protein [Nannocystis pusilla]